MVAVRMVVVAAVLMALSLLPCYGQSSASAQTVRECIAQNRFFPASNYSVYPDTALLPLTDAPVGKHPFYISHYGRHGSRYLSNRKAYDIPYMTLLRADSLDNLTDIGREVMRQLKNIIDDAEDRWGDLSGYGKSQQRGIIKRMVKRFPKVFADSAFIDARSTTVHRCIITMGSAIQQLARQNPLLDIRMEASKRDLWYMNHQDRQLRDSMKSKRALANYSMVRRKLIADRQLVGSIFRDPDKMFGSKKDDEGWFKYYLILTGLIQKNTHMSNRVSIIDLVSNDDLYHFWESENGWWYLQYGGYLMNGGKQPFMQRFLLRRMIEQADSIIQTGKHGAHLRYGHETIILPLVCLMGINGYDLQTDNLGELEEKGWWSNLVFPMSSNVQLVFYRTSPSDNDVIFKVLLNENEATLPLPTDIAPYYHWRDFRSYYLNKIEAYEEWKNNR